MIFREFSFTTLTGAIATELQGFRFNFNNLFSFFVEFGLQGLLWVQGVKAYNPR